MIFDFLGKMLENIIKKSALKCQKLIRIVVFRAWGCWKTFLHSREILISWLKSDFGTKKDMFISFIRHKICNYVCVLCMYYVCVLLVCIMYIYHVNVILVCIMYMYYLYVLCICIMCMHHLSVCRTFG